MYKENWLLLLLTVNAMVLDQNVKIRDRKVLLVITVGTPACVEKIKVVLVPSS